MRTTFDNLGPDQFLINWMIPPLPPLPWDLNNSHRLMNWSTAWKPRETVTSHLLGIHAQKNEISWNGHTRTQKSWWQHRELKPDRMSALTQDHPFLGIRPFYTLKDLPKERRTPSFNKSYPWACNRIPREDWKLGISRHCFQLWQKLIWQPLERATKWSVLPPCTGPCHELRHYALCWTLLHFPRLLDCRSQSHNAEYTVIKSQHI